MKTTMIEWHNVKTDGLPKEDGWYLTAGDAIVAERMYSARHRMFNTMDFQSDEDALATAIEVDWWAELPILDAEE